MGRPYEDKAMGHSATKSDAKSPGKLQKKVGDCFVRDLQRVLIEAGSRHGYNGTGKHGFAGFIMLLHEEDPAAIGRMLRRAISDLRNYKRHRFLTSEEVKEQLISRGLPLKLLDHLPQRTAEEVEQLRREDALRLRAYRSRATRKLLSR
jgi:hypothetical protein